MHSPLRRTACPAHRERILAFLNRAEVADDLACYGVALADPDTRVAALSDGEAAELGARIESLPGGGPFEASLRALLVVLILFATSLAVDQQPQGDKT
jgi:hypothetical protein